MQYTLCILFILCILCTLSLSKSLLMLHVIMNSKTYSYLQHPRSNMAMPQKKLLFKFAFWKAEVERMRERPQDDLMQLVQCLRSIFLKKKRSILIFLSVHTISNFMFSDSDWNWVSTVYLPHFLQYSLQQHMFEIHLLCNHPNPLHSHHHLAKHIWHYRWGSGRFGLSTAIMSENQN